MSLLIPARTIGAGFAVAATAALAQLGLAYGFGLLWWAEDAYRSNTNLAWVAWFAAVSCVVGGPPAPGPAPPPPPPPPPGPGGRRGPRGAGGAAGGARAVGPRAPRAALAGGGGAACRGATVVAGALGAFIVGPLVSLSAERGAALQDYPVEPLIAAAVGVAVGFVLALIALGSRAVAVNVGASVALVWLLAVLATFTDIGQPATPVAELAIWGSWAEPDSVLGRRGFSIAIPFVIGSFLIGAAVAAVARLKPITSSGYRIAAASGIAGPLIVTVAHLVAGPANIESAQGMAVSLVGPYAAIAGLMGSLIVSAVPRSGGQVDDMLDDRPAVPSARGSAESAPGWTVPAAPAAPASAFDDARPGDTEELPGGPADDLSGDPDVDWVQELKPVGPGADSATTTAKATAKTTAAEPEADSKPKRRSIKKRTSRRSRKTESDESTEASAKDDSED
jgi:hypothetical protein